MTTERAAIIRNKLVIVTDNGCIIGLGIRGFRTGLKQIEDSKLPLKASTIARANVFRVGIAKWEARA